MIIYYIKQLKPRQHTAFARTKIAGMALLEVMLGIVVTVIAVGLLLQLGKSDHETGSSADTGLLINKILTKSYGDWDNTGATKTDTYRYSASSAAADNQAFQDYLGASDAFIASLPTQKIIGVELTITSGSDEDAL